MKSVLLSVILLATLLTSSYGQGLYSDVNFLKATNQMWLACYSLKSLDFDRVTHQDAETKKAEVIPILKKCAAKARKSYDAIKLKYPNDKEQLNKLKLWIEVVEKIESDYLLQETWDSQPTWSMGYTLLKMDLEDLANQKL